MASSRPALPCPGTPTARMAGARAKSSTTRPRPRWRSTWAGPRGGSSTCPRPSPGGRLPTSTRSGTTAGAPWPAKKAPSGPWTRHSTPTKAPTTRTPSTGGSANTLTCRPRRSCRKVPPCLPPAPSAPCGHPRCRWPCLARWCAPWVPCACRPRPCRASAPQPTSPPDSGRTTAPPSRASIPSVRCPPCRSGNWPSWASVWASSGVYSGKNTDRSSRYGLRTHAPSADPVAGA